jgi:fission 1 protein
MFNDLPYAAEADSQLSVTEIEVLEDAYKRACLNSVEIPPQVKFNYAWGLIRSKYRGDQTKGVELFKEIFQQDHDRRRECSYYLALGYYRLGDYVNAKKFNDLLYNTEPGNLQASSLKELIDEKVRQEGFKGIAIIGGAAIALAATLFISLKKK